MHVRRLNRLLLAMEPLHPARKFLEKFVECHRQCVGLEMRPDPIDQEFVCPDGRGMLFSHFAYECLAFDVVLDGWLTNAPCATDSERLSLARIPEMRAIMHACKVQAVSDGNNRVIPYVQQVLELLDHWEQCINARLALIRPACALP